jgi:HEAT repeat protein
MIRLLEAGTRTVAEAEREKACRAAQSLGWMEEEAAISPLRTTVAQGAPLLRIAAISALVAIGADESYEAYAGTLIDLACDEGDETVRTSAIEVLRRLPEVDNVIRRQLETAQKTGSWQGVLDRSDLLLRALPQNEFLHMIRAEALVELRRSPEATDNA